MASYRRRSLIEAAQREADQVRAHYKAAVASAKHEHEHMIERTRAQHDEAEARLVPVGNGESAVLTEIVVRDFRHGNMHALEDLDAQHEEWLATIKAQRDEALARLAEPPEAFEVVQNTDDLPKVIAPGIVVMQGDYYVEGRFGIAAAELAAEWVEA